MRIAFIGGGNMGEAILSAVLSRGLARQEEISLSDISKERLDSLKKKYGIRVTISNADAVPGSEVVLLAIKPQNLTEVAASMKNCFKPEQLVLSIIAGARLKTLRQGLNHNRIVRSMPNTPAQIGEGITMWVTTAEVIAEQKDKARAILGVMGKEIYVTNEALLDMATAVSGSGPAYVFLFMEALLMAAERIGLAPDTAKALVFQTVLGSARFAEKSDKTLAELRRMVTSPGGTTAEALARFEKGGFTEIVYEAILAAYNKSKSLGA
ncbi:MAG: pyrroline-5-carboxylate reductase [Chloroflexota bacterium]